MSWQPQSTFLRYTLGVLLIAFGLGLLFFTALNMTRIAGKPIYEFALDVTTGAFGGRP